jgi:hypothetical protein
MVRKSASFYQSSSVVRRRDYEPQSTRAASVQRRCRLGGGCRGSGGKHSTSYVNASSDPFRQTGRTALDCMRHAQPKTVAFKWNARTDDRLLEAVQKYGTDNWYLGELPRFRLLDTIDFGMGQSLGMYLRLQHLCNARAGMLGYAQTSRNCSGPRRKMSVCAKPARCTTSHGLTLR